MATDELDVLETQDVMVSRVLEAFKDGKALDVYADDPQEAQYQIALRNLEAGSWEELASPQAIVKAADVVNVPLRVSAVRFYPSSYFEVDNPKTNPPAFEVLEATLLADALGEGNFDIAHAKGDVIAVSVGGWDAFSFFLRAASQGWIGSGTTRDVVIKEVTTKSGRTARKIEGVG